METYQRLGKKTFWIFVMQRIHAAGTLLAIAVALLILQSTQFARTGFLGNIQPELTLAAWGAFLLFILVLGVTLLAGWIIYANYKFCLGKDSLKIKRGVLNKEEIAIPYRQIQDADIERDFAFQMMGLSRLVILTAGHEEDSAKEDESEGVLPAMSKELAETLQAQLLQRANIQKVTEEPAPQPQPQGK